MIRVRFAPSPTGALHIGGARTALFNWLFARNQGGVFILRIEDTDQVRSTQEANKAIFDGLKWLGLDWDEGPEVSGKYGPYFQAERMDLYKKYADQLINDGKAYYCFCTTEELEKKRQEAALRKEPPKYDSKCRSLTPEEVKKNLAEGKPYVVRFKLPQTGDTIVDDKSRGKVVFKNDLLDDFVIVKSDTFPTYNFACVIDDHLMEITHVIRGDDHLSNTPRQILLYVAFGWKPPKYAHIPMILGKDKARLSKRHGATSVIAYHELGYLPEAMINYIARLGWGHGNQEVFSREELIKLFSLGGVVKTPAVFDLDKLNWLNGKYIRVMLPERLISLCQPLLQEAFGQIDLEYMKKVILLLQERLVLIKDVVPLSKYFFTDDFEFDQEAVDKHLKSPEAKKILETLKDRLAKLEPFTKDKIEVLFKELAAELGLKLGQVIHPCRLALTGTLQSPPMYDLVEVLGKEKVVVRLTKSLGAFAS